MHAPRAVHACTFFNVDVDDDDDSFSNDDDNDDVDSFSNDDVDDDVDYYPLRFARPP